MTNGQVGGLVGHHLRLFGAHAHVLNRPTAADVGPARALADIGTAVIALLPGDGFSSGFGVETSSTETGGAPLYTPAGVTLSTLAPYISFSGPGEPLVLAGSAAVWLATPVGGAGVVFVGTDLELDLRRFRQGDPALAANRPEEPLWGIPGERPLYLFEPQLDPTQPRARFADRFASALATAVSRLGGAPLPPLLPGGAPGAVVITGDDDQAFLEMYDRQLGLIDGLPITYFLHPQTRHEPGSLRRLAERTTVELGLHPDALEAPERYSELLAEQAAWFAGLTGSRARSVRNHGFLNDGYWGHLESWLREGLTISSNIPGVDGRVVTGSLLPARVELDGRLTEHWSILTAIGDGVVFALGHDPEAAATCVTSLAEEILEESLPGVIVLNLHPQNVERTESLHEAARELVRAGFLGWTLGRCVDWFEARDRA